MTVVIDTNVMLSGLVWDGVPFEVISACLEGRAVLALSPEILTEYEQVGQQYQKGHPSVFMGQLLAQLAEVAVMVQGVKIVGPLCRDPDDDKFIACAMAANADCIVSGDKDLLVLDGRFNFRIVRPREWLDQVAPRS